MKQGVNTVTIEDANMEVNELKYGAFLMDIDRFSLLLGYITIDDYSQAVN